MPTKDKDTIYIDVDDEITGIIDKLQGSPGKVVALVLPKRAAQFQSIVNMKLLKRAADSGKKNLVLITAEAGLLPLAGAAGIHVAKTLTSKPEIPVAPTADEAAETVPESATVEPDEPLPDKEAPIGQLAGATAVGAAAKPAADGVETLTLPDDELADAAKPGAKDFKPPIKKNKKLKIPNFNRFRATLVIGGAILLLLILALIFATIGAKATINISTDATNVNTNLTLGLSTTAKNLDPVNNIVPAKLVQEQKTYTQQVATTGQKNNGAKATGSVTMTAQVCGSIPFGPPDSVPAGAGISANNQTYITQDVTSFSSSGKPKGGCLYFDSNGPTSITAQSGGSSFNLPGNTNFSVRSGVTGTGSASGGTDSIVQTVNQNDINNAKGKIVPNDSQLKTDLQNQLKGQSLYPILATYVAGTPIVTSSANVGEIASNVTVTEAVTYSMFGVKQSDLTTLIDNQINTQIDTAKQSVLDTGLSNAVFNVNSISATAAQLSLSTKATAGPHLDVNDIKQQAAGKRVGAIKGQLSNNPDVTDVKVSLSPFWISTAPKKTSHITVHIAKPKTTVKASTNGSKP